MPSRIDEATRSTGGKPKCSVPQVGSLREYAGQAEASRDEVTANLLADMLMRIRSNPECITDQQGYSSVSSTIVYAHLCTAEAVISEAKNKVGGGGANCSCRPLRPL